MAQTSNRVSRLASQYAKLTPESLKARCSTDFMREATAQDIRTLAASLLRQDEYRGVRGFIRKVTGR